MFFPSVPSCLKALTVCLLLFLASQAQACKVPVFRYALEHWQPDPYRVVILHRGSLPAQADALVARLEAMAVDPITPVNLEVIRGDVADTEELEELAEILGPDFRDITEPEIVLLYPARSNSGPLAWRGPLTAENVAAMIDSPARQKLAQWILDGESAIWVLIPVGDEAKDQPAKERLLATLSRMEETLEMRDIEVIKGEKEFNEDAAVELRIGFKLLELDPNDPQEKIFAAMILNSEDGLRELNQPIAVPVFGRGRTYLAMAGKGINPDTIETDCQFLIGDCSCEVKRQNPGVDLLFAINWDELVVGSAGEDKPLPELAGIGEYVDPNDVEDKPLPEQTPHHSTPAGAPAEQPNPNEAASESSDATAKRAEVAEAELATTDSFGQRVTMWLAGFGLLGVVVVALTAMRIRSRTRDI